MVRFYDTSEPNISAGNIYHYEPGVCNHLLGQCDDYGCWRPGDRATLGPMWWERLDGGDSVRESVHLRQGERLVLPMPVNGGSNVRCPATLYHYHGESLKDMEPYGGFDSARGFK